jgi:hypothetical protein
MPQQCASIFFYGARRRDVADRRDGNYEAEEHAGHSTLTLGVLPLEPERTRLLASGLECGPIEHAEHFYIMRMRDPDQNLVVLASARRT